MPQPENPFDLPPAPTEKPVIYTAVYSEDDVARVNMSSNAGKNSAHEQGVEIPSTWKATVAEPVPVVRCKAMSSTTGERCKKWSLRGTTVCVRHGGNLPNVKEHAEAVVDAARMRIMGLTDEAVDGLEELIQVGTAPQIRLNAIKEVLDRAGLKGGPDLAVEVSHTISYKDEISNRLKEIKERKAALDKAKEEILDAEVVDEPEEG